MSADVRRSSLAKRLVRHALSIGGGTLAATYTSPAVAAGVPPPLVIATVKAAMTVAAGGAATAMVSARVAALTKGVLGKMLLMKLKITAGMIAAVTFVAIGGSLVALPTLLAEIPAGSKPAPQSRALPTLLAGQSVDGPEQPSGSDDSQQVKKVYKLQHANGKEVVRLLQSLFIVINQENAYATFLFDEKTKALIVTASGEHQMQIARVLALVDTPQQPLAEVVARKGSGR